MDTVGMELMIQGDEFVLGTGGCLQVERVSGRQERVRRWWGRCAEAAASLVLAVCKISARKGCALIHTVGREFVMQGPVGGLIWGRHCVCRAGGCIGVEMLGDRRVYGDRGEGVRRQRLLGSLWFNSVHHLNHDHGRHQARMLFHSRTCRWALEDGRVPVRLMGV